MEEESMMKKRWVSGALAFAIAVSLLLLGVLPVASAGQDASSSIAGEAVGPTSDVEDGLEGEAAGDAEGEESVLEKDAPSIEESRSDISETLGSDGAETPVVRRKRELSSSGDLEYTLDFNWATVADKRNYDYDPADSKKLLITPDANGQRTVAWRVNLRVQHGEEAVLPAGSVKITVPSYLFETWRDEGDPTLVNVKVGERLYEELTTLNWQISKAPTESAGSDFNYTDNGNGTYTLTNYKDLTGGFLFDFE